MESNIKNIVFDLAGVVFARNKERCPEELLRFFCFVIPGHKMPAFWEDYDRGIKSIDEVAEALGKYRNCSTEYAHTKILEAITYQDEIAATKQLISELKAAGHHLFVLSNMSREYIDYLRRKEVYAAFEGEVISCEVGLCKPEQEIYKCVLSRYNLKADETLFLDDRAENVDAAIACGMGGLLFDRNEPERSCNIIRQMLNLKQL